MNLSYEGRTYPPTEPYYVSRGQIREFAQAVGIGHPACHDVDAAKSLGYRDIVAPPTFPIVVTRPAAREVIQDPGLAMDYARVVHGQQTFEFRRPIVAGDVLQVVVAIERIWSRNELHLLTTRSSVSTADGEEVVTAWSTLIERIAV